MPEDYFELSTASLTKFEPMDADGPTFWSKPTRTTLPAGCLLPVQIWTKEQTMELLEIYDRLGLIYPNLYNAIARQKMGLSYPRQSGRTTNMLCRALHASQQGAVLVLVYDKQEADLKKKVRAWAEYLGLDHKNIIVERPQNEYSYSGMKLYAYFADHLLREHGKVKDGVLHQLQRATQRWSQ